MQNYELFKSPTTLLKTLQFSCILCLKSFGNHFSRQGSTALHRCKALSGVPKRHYIVAKHFRGSRNVITSLQSTFGGPETSLHCCKALSGVIRIDYSCVVFLKEFRNRWFVFGSKATDLVLYNLALDRIVSIEPIDLPFRENPIFDSEHFFDDVIGVSKNISTKPRKIKFWASEKQSQYIMTKPIHTSQKLVQQNEDGSCVFKIEVVMNFEMYYS